MLLGRSFRPASVRAWQQQNRQQRLQHLGFRLLSQRQPRQDQSRSPVAATTIQLAYRPQIHPTTIAGRRWETTTTGDDKSGHISSDPGEGILFLDNVFPLRIGNLLAWRPWRTSADYDDADISQLLKRFSRSTDLASSPASSTAPSNSASSSLPSSPSPSSPSSSTPSFLVSIASIIDPVSLVRRAIPENMNLTVTEVVPRLKDGGVFVKFRHPPGTQLEDIEAQLAKTLLTHPVRPWFNPFWGCMRAGLVRGIPWLEDLASRVPSNRMRVEFCAPPAASNGNGGVGDASGSANLELSQETIYSLFRRYGKIAEISSQPFDSKILPRYATIDFMRIRDAVMARSCLHGFVVNGTTRLRMSYEPRARAHHIWDWLTSHPRIVIPILAALLATITVAVFDPIRSFFIRAHVQHSLSLKDSQLWKWFQRRTSAFVTFARDSYDAAADNMGIGTARSRGARSLGQDALMTHRRDLLESLRTWLLETAGTFIVVQGPRGSGKNELVIDQALRGRRDVLVIDCKPIVEARGESSTIKKIATAIGYRPVFSWANNLSSLVDLAVQGTTGVKSGFSETLDEQLSKILQTATAALRDVSLAGRHKTDVDANLNEDAYLEAHPERRAVIVLDNFGQRNEEATGLVYDKLAEWAATLVQANIAHVVFLTSDTSYPKALVKAMPDRVFRQIALGDLSPEVAMNYVLSHLAQAEGETESNESESTDDQNTGDSTTSATPASVLSAAADAQKSQGKADEKPEEKSQSIIEKVSLPFRRKKDTDDSKKSIDSDVIKDAAVSDSSAKAQDSTHKPLATPPPSQVPKSSDRSIVNAATAKAVLAAENGATGATKGSFSLSVNQQEVIKELDSCIGVLGGRLTDLESLVRRLKSGQTPKRAVSEIVEQSASEIIKMYLLSQPKASGGNGSAASSSGTPAASSSASSAGRLWTAEQAWFLVREIAANSGSVSYNDVLLSDTFASSSNGIAAIDALAAAELVVVRSYRGRPQSIKAGSPVYLAAFEFLGSDTALAARLDRCVVAEKAAIEAKTVAKVEQELALLGSLPRQPPQTTDRIAYLLNKLQASQSKIVAYEAEIARLKKAMSEAT